MTSISLFRKFTTAKLNGRKFWRPSGHYSLGDCKSPNKLLFPIPHSPFPTPLFLLLSRRWRLFLGQLLEQRAWQQDRKRHVIDLRPDLHLIQQLREEIGLRIA